MRTIDKTLSVGETISLPSDGFEAVTVENANGGVRVKGVVSGDGEREFVAVRVPCDGSELDDYPDSTEVLGITAGSGMQSSQAWLLIPQTEYER